VIPRRKALKAGVAGVGAAVVWAEPTVRGLARRPAYAAGGSNAPAETLTVTISGTITGTGAGRVVSGLIATPSQFGTGVNAVSIGLAPGTGNGTNPGTRSIDLGPTGLTWDVATLGGAQAGFFLAGQSTGTQLQFRGPGQATGGFTIVIDITCPADFTG